MAFDYDLFVIGAGSGGVRAARIAAQNGARVAIAEEHLVGGTCVIRGCVPKKLFVYASSFAHDFEIAKTFGWHTEPGTFDWNTLVYNKDKEVDRLNKVYITNLEKAGVRLYQERAVLIDRHTVELASGVHIRAKILLIAVGGTPFVPEFEGSQHVITSNEVFYLDKLPKRIAIVGGGYIAVEFACIFHGLGVETTLVYRGDQVLKRFDKDLRQHLSDELAKKGLKVLTNTQVRCVEKSASGLKLTFEKGGTLKVDQVLYATGRIPKTKDLGLEKVGVKTLKSGHISVDSASCTSVENIYAVGDVTGRAELTPVAIREGHAMADTLYAEHPWSVDHSNIATAVFSQPEIGTVGATEQEALEIAPEGVEVYLARFKPMKLSFSHFKEKMLFKVLVAEKSGKVLGVHIAGHGAGELIQVLGIALKMGATKQDFDRTIAVHPTAAEELVTLSKPVRIARRTP